MHIGINAHLLSAELGYRSAGIHGYIYNTLSSLYQVAPPDWLFTAMVGKGNQHTFNGVNIRHSAFTTKRPIKRVLWEQTVQPLVIGNFDMYHAMAFVSPLVIPIPSVVTIYDLSFVHYPKVLSPARRLYLRLFTELSCKRAKRIIAISHSTARDIHETFGIPKDKIDVAACGYNADLYKPLSQQDIDDFRQQQGLPDRFWLFLGTLEPRKNLPTLIKAYAVLPKSERLPLVLGGGEGWLTQEIYATIEEHGVQDDVHFPGFLPPEDLPLWYNCAETFVYPSIFEGFGLPVLEAMACGTPVIISNASSLPEVAGDAGQCIEPLDVDAWTDALHTAYLNEGWRAEASQRGIEQAKQFSWTNTAEQTIKTYQKAFQSS